MKKALKILLVFASLLLSALLILPWLFKDQIAEKIRVEAEKNLNARLSFSDYGLNFWRQFPDLNFRLVDLTIAGIGKYDKDTLLYSKNLDLRIDVLSLLGKNGIEVKNFKLDQALVQLLSDSIGNTNWDIVKTDSTATEGSPSEAEPFRLNLRSYQLSNSRLVYSDEALNFYLELDSINHSGKGNFSDALFQLSTSTEAKSTLRYEGVQWMNSVHTLMGLDLEVDQKNQRYVFKENELKLNDFKMTFAGEINMPDESIRIDLNLKSPQNSFRDLLSLIPGMYTQEFASIKAEGDLSWDAWVKGVYSETQLPGFGLNLKVNRGGFQYPDLPERVRDLLIDVSISNPDGVPDHSLVDLKKFHAQMGTDQIDARLLSRNPVSDPQMQGQIKGKVNFAQLPRLIPDLKSTELKGILDADLKFNLRKSFLDKKEYDKIQAEGGFKLSDFFYKGPSYPEGFGMQIARVNFQKEKISLDEFRTILGNSDLSAFGVLLNPYQYLMGTTDLDAELSLISNRIVLSDFMKESASATPSPADTGSASSFVEIPDHIRFKLNTVITKLEYEKYILENISGQVLIANKSLNLEKLSFNTLEGTARMNGVYSTPTASAALFQYVLDFSGIDIQRSVKTIGLLPKLAPVTERAEGKVSGNLAINGKTDHQMNPVLNSLNGSASVRTSQLIIKNFPPLVKIAEQFKLDQFKELPVRDAEFRFVFSDGRVQLKPTTVVLWDIPSNLEGSSGFDQTIDYTIGMNIPTRLLPGKASAAVNQLIEQANSKGARFKMSETVKVNAKLTGSITDPKLSTDIKETAGGAIDDLKNAAKEEADRLRKEAEQKAQAEIDRLKKEAEQKLNSETERLRKEAEEKARKEKERLKKEAEQKAKDALNNLFGKPK